MRIVNRRISTALLSALAAVLASGWFGAKAQEVAGAPPASIPTFSTADIERQGHFYVGGHYVGDPPIMDGAMYVEVWVPKKIRHPYPMLLVCGGIGRTGYDLLQTPDGRPGWAYYFVRRGYTVYMIDYPGRGRSAYVPGVDGQLLPPRSGPLMEEVWTGGRSAASDWCKQEHILEHRREEFAEWPQAKKYTEWPSDAPNKGKMGDPVFDNFARSEVDSASGPRVEKMTTDALVALVDLIGHPVILLLHSGVATSGWELADARPGLIKGIVAVEPVAPPIENAERGASGPGRLWGLSNLPVRYDPPIQDPSELQPVRQQRADGPGLIPCWVQKEPAHRLVNLEAIPVLDVSGEASYHRPYAHCVAKWLNQAGVKTTYVRLEDVGLTGNGHMMMLERNSDEIAEYLESWIEKNVY
jgi:pimeloyl-ACP methyl ester carboxylesterase